MNPFQKHIFIAALLFCSVNLMAQKKELRNDVIQQRLEFIAQQYESSSIDFSTLIEVLYYYFDHPLSLNIATKSELESISLLSPFQIRTLLNHRVQFGDLISIYELRNLEGFDFVTLQNIVPFVEISSSNTANSFNLKKSLKYGHQEIISLWGRTLEQQFGCAQKDSNTSENSRYMGDPNRLYLRYRFVYGTNLSFGITAEKDPGEEFFKGSNPNGFDFYSAHLFASNIGIIRQVTIGDFHAQFGQGLTFWSGFSYRKTADALNIARYARKLSPYASRNENNFLRGIGTTITLNNFELTAFYSKKAVDANLIDRDTLSAQDQSFTTLQESGLHRTPNEIANKKAVSEQIMGANMTWSNTILKLGTRLIHSKYGFSIDRSTQLYQKFSLDTNQWYNGGLDANLLVKNINFFGDFSMSSNGGWAYLAGALFKLDDRMSFTIVNRNFQPNYLSIYSNSFGERSDNTNEKGTYVGLKTDISNKLIFTGYVDNYQFDWLSYYADGPLKGLDYMARLQFHVTRYLDIYARFRQESQTINQNTNQNIKSLGLSKRNYLRFNLTFSASKTLKLNSRVEFSNSNSPGASNGNGFAIYQDLQIHFNNQKSTLTGRVALFDVNDYNARIYAYENDVLYYFSVPAFYNRGSRIYLVYHYKPFKKFEVWAKLSRTFLSHETTIGSGPEMIQGPQKTELRIQVRYKF